MLNLSKLLFKYYFGLSEDYLVPLGPQDQPGSLFASIYIEQLWKETPLYKKLWALMKFNWKPDNETILSKAKIAFMSDVFGTINDYGDKLYLINCWHNYRSWNFDQLTVEDIEKAEAIQGTRLLTAMRHRQRGTHSLLHLNLAIHAPDMCVLVKSLVFKIPIISLRFCLEIQENYAFNSIRESKHPQADELIAYLYDTLLIQQKIAISFHELLKLLGIIVEKSDQSALLTAEIDSITTSDAIVNYLKATVEKILVMIGLIYGIANLETYKTHQKKLNYLEPKLSDVIKSQQYFQFIWKYMQSDELGKLNNLRTGLLHKKGISKLQPHAYLDKKVKGQPLLEMFETLKEQHGKNTAILIGMLALLTDDLMIRSPIDVSEQLINALVDI